MTSTPSGSVSGAKTSGEERELFEGALPSVLLAFDSASVTLTTGTERERLRELDSSVVVNPCCRLPIFQEIVS